MAQQANPSVYVGNLDPAVTEPMLFDLLKGAGPITSVRVCTDSQTAKSLCYAYVNFQNPADAEKAIDTFSGTKLLSKPIRVCRVFRDPLHRRQGLGNLYIKNLPKDIDNTTLRQIFNKFGKILSIHIPADPTSGEGRGYAYVDFEQPEAASNAINELNNTEHEGKEITVERYKVQHREERLKDYKNLYIKGLKNTVTDDQLKAFFAQFGNVTSSCIRRDKGSSESTGTGYVAFEQHDAAMKAIDTANEKPCELAEDGGTLKMCRFQSKVERQRTRERMRREKQLQNSKYPNLYVKHLSEDVTSEKLKELFETVGETVSVRVMRDSTTGISRCFGFVSMKDAKAADLAIQRFSHSTIFGPRPLFLTHALRRDARLAALQEQQKKSRMPRPLQNPMGGGFNPAGMAPAMGPPFGNLMPSAMPFALRPQMPGGPLRMGPNLVQQLPLMGMGAGRPMGIPQQAQRPLPPRLPQPNFPPSNLPAQQMHQPQQPMATAVPPQTQQLSSLLASMTPDQQKNVLGERLYSIIQRQHSSEAAKVTGMLLEMDNGEILNLLDSPDQLESKVQEALEVLERHKGA